jgi:NAD-dependent protein deacetylase/lipoamidase
MCVPPTSGAGLRPLDAARERIAVSEFLFVLTGSGISAESGIPTFRDAGGYWREHDVTALATPQAFQRNPRLVWDWYLERRRTVRAAAPNAAHEALAVWLQRRPGLLITQNVDGLHERAGTPGVVRYHGSLWTNICSGCRAERPSEDLAYETLPVSPCCGAPERPGVVWFGEMIPRAAMDAVERALGEADVLLVVGTSEVVFPAAGITERARDRGIQVVIVNTRTHGRPGDILVKMPAARALPRMLA